VLELKPDDVRTLVDLGFLAVSYGLSDKAAPIFAAVRATRPTLRPDISVARSSTSRAETSTERSELCAHCRPPTLRGHSSRSRSTAAVTARRRARS
jgi:hypothetical protein